MHQRRKKARIPSKQFQDNVKHEEDDDKDSNFSTRIRKGSKPTNLFPLWLPWVLVLLTLVTRVMYVTNSKSWWILHPDEVFQGVEVSHSLVYGYGFRMYEYLPPVVHNRTTVAEDQENSLGIYSLKSFLYPFIYTPFLYIIKYTGLNINSFVVCKCIHAVLSSTLPLSIYIFTTALFRSSDIAVLTSIFVTFSLHLNIFGTHCLVNSLLSPVLFLCLSQLLFFIDSEDETQTAGEFLSSIDFSFNNLKERIKNALCLSKEIAPAEKEKNYFNNFSVVKISVCSYVLGLIVYIQLELLLPIVCLIVMDIVRNPQYLFDIRKHWSRYQYIRGGLTLAFISGGFLDNLTYGMWFLSPVQWLKLSFVRDLSSQNLDMIQPLYYVHWLNANRACTWLNTITVFVIFINLKRSKYKWPTASILVTVSSMMVVYSMHWHKEPRLIYNVYIFMCMLWSVAIETVISLLDGKKRKWISLAAISVVIAAYAFDNHKEFPKPSASLHSQWTNNDMVESVSVNECIQKLGKRWDVTGVFVDYTLYATGGFSLLNKDVPLITKVQHEYYEYDLSDRPLYRSALDPRIRAMNRMSDIIHTLSSKYLYYTLSNKKHYNYILTFSPEKYETHTFRTVFNCNNLSVMKRSKLVKKTKFTEGSLNVFSPIPDVLEYEGSWLLTIGHYQKSSERLRASLSLGSKRIRPYQLLSLCHYKSGNYSAVRQIETECYGRYGQKKCDEPQPRLILNQNIQFTS